jgi:hypothetical protein
VVAPSFTAPPGFEPRCPVINKLFTGKQVCFLPSGAKGLTVLFERVGAARQDLRETARGVSDIRRRRAGLESQLLL